MSVIVFAGSSQFIAVSMLSAGASAPAIITTTFVVNLRHVLMSSALAVYLRAAHRGLLALFAYGVTDESFAVNLAKFRDSQWDLNSALVTNHTANLTWIVTTMLGGIDLSPYDLDGPLPDPLPGPPGSVGHHEALTKLARETGMTIRQLGAHAAGARAARAARRPAR